MVFREFIEYTFRFLLEAALHVVNFVLRWGMNVQNYSTVVYTTSYH
jgi:hypothetical protein